ncbi:hypothetical protein ACFE04_009759 [Oxalis oulophora]
MESSKSTTLLLICMLFISSFSPILGCGSCGDPYPPKHKVPKHPPIVLPPVIKPPGTLPPIPKFPVPPVTVPPVPKLPPVTVPTIPKLPPVPVITNPPSVGGKPAPCTPTPTVQPTCPIDTLKLGACVDLLGGLVHIGLGDPVVNTCCPVLAGLVELEAAVCLCTTLKLSVLNLNVFVPLALQLLVTCGKTPPPGYTCTL